MHSGLIAWVLMVSLLSTTIDANGGSSRKSKAIIQELSDVKDWKKLIKTKTNVLIYFGNGKSSFQSKGILSVLQEAAELIKGIGTVAIADCAGEGKKLCKKVKASPAAGQYVLKHYNNGEFNKDYDRADRLSSIVNFMKDPTGDLPWEEDETAKDVLHLPDLASLQKTLKKESSSGKGILVMFYAPWCGFCKRMKPDYSAVATDLKDEAIVAAMDCNKPETGSARQKYNITGFPTIYYFRNGQMKQQYEGENNKDAIAAFLKNPDAPPVEKPKEADWSDEPSEVVHLNVDTFDTTIEKHSSVLIMFYAPWCGHCKKMKPAYVAAAQRLKDLKIDAVLAAVDATKEPSLGKKYDVKGYPTVKYFKDGTLAFDADVRTEESIVNFMRDPKEPPPPPPPEKPWAEEDSAVVHLTEENFKSELRKKKNALVMFYAPWCGHCKRTKPEFTAAAEELKDDPKIAFAAIDCTEHPGVCKAYEVQGYPTFKKFHYLNKEPVEEYNGGRTKEDMIEDMRRSRSTRAIAKDWDGIPGQEYVYKLSEGNYSNFLKSHESALVMFYAPWCGHCKVIKPEYALAAMNLARSSIPAALASCDCDESPKMVERFQLSGYPTVIHFRNGRPQGEYNQGRSAMDIINFMTSQARVRDEF